jgi:hypothetical protein
MAKARKNGKDYDVRVTQDLADNWSIDVIQPPPTGKSKYGMPHRSFDESPSEVIKVRADTRESALKAGLELLKKYGKIDDFFI